MRLFRLTPVFLLLFANHSFGQTSAGALVGLVRDPAGAAIPAAAITVTNT
ncbi:MAG: hypothetical protein ACKV22_11405 [Bryobacteraceae bacterium]